MDKNELCRLLISTNVPVDLYSLNGGLPNEAFCLNKENHYWEVYYSERGIKSESRQFKLENEACEDFWERISKMLNLSQ